MKFEIINGLEPVNPNLPKFFFSTNKHNYMSIYEGFTIAVRFFGKYYGFNCIWYRGK